MHEDSDAPTTIPAPGRDVLTAILRNGAQRLLGQAIETEVDAWVEQHALVRDERGHQQVVRNGHHPPRTLVTGVGPLEVKQPRVLDRRIAGRNAGARSLPSHQSGLTWNSSSSFRA